MSDNPVTLLLDQAREGDPDAASELLPLVYTELRRMARSRMARERPGQTLQPTALVHEAFLRLVGDKDVGWANRRYFFGAAAEAMRRILIERAREKARLKRGAQAQRVTFDENRAPEGLGENVDLLALDQALSRLEERDARMSDVVKLRYFAGLTIDEIAAALDIAPRSVSRLWESSRVWLFREMR